MTRQTHRAAVVIFVEAEGVDSQDAGTAAQLAISRLIHQHQEADTQALVPPIKAACASCGVRFDPDELIDGNIRRHVECERWSPEALREDQVRDGFDEPLQDACEGSEQPPRESREPVVGFTRPDGLMIYARVHEVMEVGMAAGNGYLWTAPTWKAFR